MALEIRISGLRSLQDRINRSPKKLDQEMRRFTQWAGEQVAGKAKRSFIGSRTRARRKGRPVTASPRYLAVDFGRYRQSIGVIVRRFGRSSWRAVVGPSPILRYPRLHEFGLGGMPKRPVMSRGAQRALTIIRRRAKNVVKRLV